MSDSTTRVVKMGIEYGDIQLLSTKEIDPQLLAGLDARGIYMDITPFTAIVPLVNNYLIQHIHQLASQKITAIFTSPNAVKAVANILNKVVVDWEIACLDKGTYFAVQEAFLSNRVSAMGKDGEQLGARLIELDYDAYRPVFFCGNRRLDTLPFLFKTKNIALEEVLVYQTMTRASEIKKTYHGILFFSPSAVESFFVFNDFPPHTVAFCIGATTANALTKKLAKPAVVVQAAEHTPASMLEAVIVYFNRK